MTSNFPYYFTKTNDVVELVTKTSTATGGGVRISNNTTGTSNSGKILEINGNIIQIGTGTTATGGNSIAIGTNANTSAGTSSISIGVGTIATGNDSVSIGNAATTSTATSSVAIGKSSTATGGNSIAIGTSANTSAATSSISIGAGTIARGNGSIAIGNTANTSSSSNSISIGTNTQSGSDSVAIGQSTTANSTSSVSVGYYSSAAGSNSIGIGNGPIANGSHSIAIGSSANVSTAVSSIALGQSATATGGNSIAIGNSASASTYTNSVAIGAGATVTANNQIAIGTTSEDVYTGRHVIVESTGTAGGTTNGSLTFIHNDIAGSSSIVFKSKKNEGSDYAYIRYQDDFNNDVNNERARFTIGTSNDSNDDLYLRPSGGVVVYSEANSWDIFLVYKQAFNANYFYINQNMSYGTTSDIRLKNDIFSLDTEVDIKFIKKISPKCFTFKDDGKKKYGFIAQEIMEAIQSLGSKYEDYFKHIINQYDNYLQEPNVDKKKYLGVGVQELIPSIVNVCKHTLNEIDNLKDEINKIKTHLGIQ